MPPDRDRPDSGHPAAPAAAKSRHRLPVIGVAPELVPARMIKEVLYCERLVYLEWAQAEFADNEFTVEGRATHTRTDKSGGVLPKPPPTDAGPVDAHNVNDQANRQSDASPSSERPYQARALWLTSERLGITAKLDVVEGDGEGNVVPIEYKRGSAPDVPEGAYLHQRAQLCAQVLLLREHGYACDHGELYFAGSRRRVRIAIDEGLVQTTVRAVARARELATAVQAPPPLIDSPKCNGCSLVGICLPDETNMLRGLEGGACGPDDPNGAAPPSDCVAPDPTEDDPRDASGGSLEDAPPGRPPLRRLHPASDDKVPLYVQEQGARIGLDGECLIVRGRECSSTTVRLPNTSHVSLYGNVQITAQAMRALLERGIPVSFFSYGGWYYGRATGLGSKNVEIAIAQHRAATDLQMCVRLARGLVASKIRNSRTLLRRNHSAPPLLVLCELERLARKAENADALDTLLGIEGTAARGYFGAFTGMFKGSASLTGTFDLEGRNRRPPKDPVNALLSFAYSLLTKDFALTLSAVGLDPLLGFYHQPRFGRPALALDLMEEFRPLVADSVVISVINGGGFGADDFQSHPTGVAMRPAARRRLLLAYEHRMDQLITHPVFGYRISYRRVLEVQARLLARHLLGEIDEYPAFRTR